MNGSVNPLSPSTGGNRSLACILTILTGGHATALPVIGLVYSMGLASRRGEQGGVQPTGGEEGGRGRGE